MRNIKYNIAITGIVMVTVIWGSGLTYLLISWGTK